MLEALVIAGIVAAPLGSAALFLPARHHERAGAGAAVGGGMAASPASPASPAPGAASAGLATTASSNGFWTR